jgi:GH25 family lysozyme M1 (1,4-beta-N-acetylmuramidase)
MIPNCIDVSTWQGDVDYSRVRACGIVAVIIRAGFGQTEYNKFRQNYRNARAAGLKVGAYWYSYAYCVADAEQEARACLEILGDRDFDLPIYYDMEEDSQMALGKSTMTAMACRFIDTVQAGGYRGGMYSSPSWFTDFLDYDLLREKYSIWLAHWASAHSRACDIWQYGEDGRIDGIDGDVDVDIIENWDVIGGDIPDALPTADDVSTVQKWLNSAYGASLEVDGICGQLTKKALISALQTILNNTYGAGLEVDGIFGKRTRAAIHNLSKGDEGEYVKALQAFLICHAYDTGGLDGEYGYMTYSSVLTFQTVHDLTVDGIAGKRTFEALANS